MFPQDLIDAFMRQQGGQPPAGGRARLDRSVIPPPAGPVEELAFGQPAFPPQPTIPRPSFDPFGALRPRPAAPAAPAAPAGEGWGVGGLGRSMTPPQLPPGPLQPSPGITPGPIAPIAPPAPAAPIGPATESFLAATKGMGAATGVAPGMAQPEAVGDAGAAKGQQAAYQPKFVQINPFTNYGYTANSPEEELMLLAQRAGFMNAANAFGTGVGPGGRQTTAREWAAVAGRGADDFLRAVLAMRGQDQARQMGEADLAQRGDLARMQMANQRGIAELEAASRSSPALLRNQSYAQLAMALATGAITPEAFQSGAQALDRIMGGGMGGGVAPSFDSADKGLGGPAAVAPAPGGVSPAELAALGAPGRAVKEAEGLVAGFKPGAEGFDADAYGASALDKLAGMSDAELKAVAAQIRNMKDVDRNAFIRALMKPGAIAHYRTAQKPPEMEAYLRENRWREPSNVPDWAIVDDATKTPLFTFRSGPQSMLGRAINTGLGEAPYTQVVDPVTNLPIEIRTSDLRQPMVGAGRSTDLDQRRADTLRRFLAARQK